MVTYLSKNWSFLDFIFFPSPLSWRRSRQTPLLPAIQCVRHIWCSKIAVCESMPLPVQTSSEGLKNGMGGKNHNKIMTAGPWFLFPSLSLPKTPHATPHPFAVFLSSVEHQMTEKPLLLGCNGLQGKVACSVGCAGVYLALTRAHYKRKPNYKRCCSSPSSSRWSSLKKLHPIKRRVTLRCSISFGFWLFGHALLMRSPFQIT